MREWKQEDLDAIGKAVRAAMRKMGMTTLFSDLPACVIRELSPRYVVRQGPESGWRYYDRVMWAVYDNHEARDLAFCPQIEEANVIAELLNKDAA